MQTDWTRRQWLSALAALAVGCRRRSPSPTEPSPPPEEPPRAPAPIGYSSVHAWQREDPARLAEHLASAGLTLTQAEGAPPRGGVDPPIDWRRLAEFTRRHREAGVLVLIDLANWNDPGWAAVPEAEWVGLVERLLGEVGPDWFEPVSEPQGERARRLQDLAIERWDRRGRPGRLVLNLGFEIPPAPPGTILDRHVCRFEDLLDLLRTGTGEILASTDCTPVLASRLSRPRVIEAVRLAAERRRPLILYDTFNQPTNVAVIEWAREALAAVSGGRP